MDEFLRVFRTLGVGRLVVLLLTTAAIVAFFGFVTLRLTEPPMTLLFGNLDLQESGEIITRLEAAKVPYRLGAGGAQIFVPDDQALRLRMRLAESGLPTGGSVGYEIFDHADVLGATSFVQNVNLVRALEGELARTIRTIDRVQNARVHLVLPKREVFSRDKSDPSASVFLKLRGGRIDGAQVRAIQNLVAAAVPDLKLSRITVVDDRGSLLASGVGGAGGGESATGLTEHRVQQEERLKRAVEQLLEKSVGRGNVRAEITVDMDLDRTTTNSESFDPDGQVVRSTQTVSEQGRSNEGQAQNVTVANNLPNAAAPDAGGQTASSNLRTEETVNYEISKTVKTQVREAGLIRRLSIAVLVNGVAGAADAQGKKTFTPRAEDELKQLASLVRSTVGFDAKRGDTVEVLSMPFTDIEETSAAPEAASFLGFTRADILRLVEVVSLGLVAVLAMLFVVRPVVMRVAAIIRSLPVTPLLPAPLMAAPALAGPGEMQASGEPRMITAEPAPIQIGPSPIDQMIDIAKVEGQVKASSMKKIGEIVDRHPEEAVAILRGWLSQQT